MSDRTFAYTMRDILAAMDHHGYKVFRGEYDLNIIGIRSATGTAGVFDDWITVSHLRSDGTWAMYAFQATTDPGLYWLENPMNVEGTAIVVPGQYRGLWRIGEHRGQYEALVQAAPVKVWRDADRDSELDPGSADEGMFGINLHRAHAVYRSDTVGKWSAGCQVIADPLDFGFLMRLCRAQERRLGYSTFTYTLLDEVDL